MITIDEHEICPAGRKQVIVRFSEDDRAAIHAAAHQLDMKAACFIRTVARQAAQQVLIGARD